MNSALSGKRWRIAKRPLRQWFLAAEAACELAAMKLVVLLISPARYGAILRGDAPSSGEQLSRGQLKELAWAVEAMGRRAPQGVNCLPRALALQRMLMRRGTAGELKFGVRRVDGQVRAHAWLEYEGRVILGNLPDLREYYVFSEWPSFATAGKSREGRRKGKQ